MQNLESQTIYIVYILDLSEGAFWPDNLCFVHSSHFPTHRLLFLKHFFKFWDCHYLGTRSIPFFLTGLCSVLTACLWILVPLPSSQLRYLWHQIESNKMDCSLICLCGLTCVRWVASYLCLSGSRINLEAPCLYVFIHLINIYWPPSTRNTVTSLMSLLCSVGRQALHTYLFVMVIKLQNTDTGFHKHICRRS